MEKIATPNLTRQNMKNIALKKTGSRVTVKDLNTGMILFSCSTNACISIDRGNKSFTIASNGQSTRIYFDKIKNEVCDPVINSDKAELIMLALSENYFTS